MRVAAVLRKAASSAASRVLFQRAIDGGEQINAAERLLDEARHACFHGADRGRHVALAGDHDRWQLMPVTLEALVDVRSTRPSLIADPRNEWIFSVI
jgi:hypothetical protein